MYKTEDGGKSWKKVMLPDVVKEELIFHEEEKYKDYIMIITAGNKVREACMLPTAVSCQLCLTVWEFWGLE